MMGNREKFSSAEIERRLPWLAAGTLDPQEAEFLERMVARDVELSRRYQLIRHELAETVRVNESLGMPSAAAAERLFAAIPRRGGRPANRSYLIAIAANVAKFVCTGRRAWVTAVAAAVLITVAVHTGGMLGSGPERDGAADAAASESDEDQTTSESLLLIRFAARATAPDIARVLASHNAAIVDGPKPGGFYRVRLGRGADGRNDIDDRIVALRSEVGVIDFAGIAP